MAEDEICRPVPAPRRLYPELSKTQYENVSVDLINKNLNINSENIQNNVSCSDKVPNNKVFLLYPTLKEETEKLNSPKTILTETNDLYGPNANEDINLYSQPTPAPRPRKPQNNETQVYENAIIKPKINEIETLCTDLSLDNRPLRRAPDLPPKIFANIDRDREIREIREIRQRSHSISSEFSTTSSNTFNNNNNNNDSDTLESRGKFSPNKTYPPLTAKCLSQRSSSSSLAESIDSSDNFRYKSPSPGYVNVEYDEDHHNNADMSSQTFCNIEKSPVINIINNIDNDLLKSLGTTSKLLTESIGERVVSKAKGAKHKFDKNLKNSSEILSNIGFETTHRLKTLGSNLNLIKRDKNKDNMSISQLNSDRPQTVPPNDTVFNTITFSSPLSRKSGGIRDLTSNERLDSSYEVPRSVKPVNSAYTFKSSVKTEFTRNSVISKSLVIPKGNSEQCNSNLNRVLEELSPHFPDNVCRDSMDLPSPPMPTIPAPILTEQMENLNSPEPVYGKLNPIQPPARQKRRKNCEEIQMRRQLTTLTPTSDECLVRVNVDSMELQKLNSEAEEAEREESLILRQLINAEEKCTPIPERSDSWEYYEESNDNNSQESSSPEPEPIYVNQEITYGNVFEMATSNKDLLTPQNTLVSITEEDSDNDGEQGAVGGVAEPPKAIIEEFDPLIKRKASTICRSDKSNQLLLLEYLLEEETYGAIKKTHSNSDDELSMCTSEEDNINVNNVAASNKKKAEESKASSLPVARTSTTVCPAKTQTANSKSSKSMQIVHQNAQLLSDSVENIISDTNDVEKQAKPYLSHVEEKPSSNVAVDLARPSENRSQWFVGESRDSSDSKCFKSNKLSIDDGESPPSYLEAIGDKSSSGDTIKTRSSRFKNTMNVFSNVMTRVDALKRKTSFKSAQKSVEVKVTLQMIPRPTLSPLFVRYEGHLVRFPSGVVEDILKEMQNRKAVLRDRQFQTFLDQEMKTPKESIALENITTVQCVSNSRVTDNSTHFYCFEITTTIPKNGNGFVGNVQQMSNPNLIMTSGSSGNVKHQRVSHLYGVSKESERDIWMQKILESLTNSVPTKYTCHYYRAGWCYLKNSITSEWSGTWLVLKKSQRRLVFVTEISGNIEKMDLRKARCIVLKESDDSIKNLHVESGPMLMIDAPPFTVYIIMSAPRETKVWRNIIREVAHNNGFSLVDQQLTKFNVPVIVDKCINFVYIHGSMSEGIYRKSGSENSIHKLMSAFRADAFNVEITRNEYNEHDVANVLKRFMRDLPERLMGKLSESFMCISELEANSEKITLYKELLARLNIIERETLKKIVGHLAFISSQLNKNKMSIQNLTMIWGPTLIQSIQAEEMIYSQKEADVLTDLIKFNKELFPLTADELKKEQEMLMCLQKYYAAAETLTDSVKKSGDLKMWIALNPNPENTTEDKTQVNVTISPTKTAYEVCQELASKMNLSTHQITLYEIILNGNLERPLHHDIKVFDVVLNWSYWPDDDRRNNILVVKPIEILNEVQRAVKNLAIITPGKELKFVDNRTKSFKSYQCELRDGKIVISKKEKNEKNTIVREIFLHSAIAYLGCEKKREFPWSWAITFVEKTQTQILRSRDTPYIGHVLAGSEWVDRTIWYSSIWYCLYGDNILPPAEIIIE
uniref:Rho-GAP domain-containing protein n=1 Tax=Glossina pallidipes TaxID=7398 RepID=A0A1B0A0W8_GLOPL